MRSALWRPTAMSARLRWPVDVQLPRGAASGWPSLKLKNLVSHSCWMYCLRTRGTFVSCIPTETQIQLSHTELAGSICLQMNVGTTPNGLCIYLQRHTCSFSCTAEMPGPYWTCRSTISHALIQTPGTWTTALESSIVASVNPVSIYHGCSKPAQEQASSSEACVALSIATRTQQRALHQSFWVADPDILQSFVISFWDDGDSCTSMRHL